MAASSSRAFGQPPSAGSASGTVAKPPTGKAPEGLEMGDLSWNAPEADRLFSEIADGAEDVIADMRDAMGHIMGMESDLPAQPEQEPDGETSVMCKRPIESIDNEEECDVLKRVKEQVVDPWRAREERILIDQ